MLQARYLLFLFLFAYGQLPAQDTLWRCGDKLLTVIGNKYYLNETRPEDASLLFSFRQGSFANHYSNAIGYRKSDNSIYGLTESDGVATLFRVSETGEYQELFPFPDTFLLPFAGCISTDDSHLILYSWQSDEIYWINLNGPSLEMETVVAAPGLRGYTFLDIAIDPLSGLVYGYEPNIRAIVASHPGRGTVEHIIEVPYEFDETHSFPSLAINSEQMLIALNTGDSYGLMHYHIPSDTFLGFLEEEYQDFAEEGEGVDGCSCLDDRIRLTKTFSKTVIQQCDQLDLVLRLHNSVDSLLGRPFTLIDSLPEGLSYEAIIYPESNIDATGLNTNKLKIKVKGLWFGLDSIVLRIKAKETIVSQRYASRSALYFQEGASPFLYSDYPGILTDSAEATPLELVLDNEAWEPVTDYRKCPDSALTIDLLPENSRFRARWYDGVMGDKRTFEQAGNYEVELFDNCGATAYMIRIRNSGPTVNLPDRATANFGGLLSLQARLDSGSPIVSQQWAIGDSLLRECPGACVSFSYTAEQPHTLYTKVTDASGCTASDSTIVQLEYQAFIPEAFSPNGDGKNDVFYVQAAENIPIEVFRIYDRWGGLVFSTSGTEANVPTMGWDGRVGDKNAPPEAYLYQVVLNFRGNRVAYSGSFHLLR